MEVEQTCDPAETAITRSITIDVSQIVSGTSWEWDWEVGNSGKKKGRIDAGNGSQVNLVFNLDKSAKDVRFDASAPFFYEWGVLPPGECPTGFALGDDFMVVSCTDTTLIVRDFNEKPGDISYALNFVNLAGDKVKSLDPIIRNGGGGRTPFGR